MRFSRLAALPFFLAATGCLTTDQIQSLQKDVSDVRAEVAQMREEQKQQSAEVERLRQIAEGSANGDRERRADLEARLRSVEESAQAAAARSEETARRTEAIATELAALRSSARSAPAPVVPGNSGEGEPARSEGSGTQDAFNAAYADYSKGNYDLAIRGFEEFLRQNAGTDLADNALYWIGACHYDKGEYETAIGVFDRLLAEYPAGDKVPGAHLKKGFAYLEMNRTTQGVVQLQYLIEHYPASDEARVARERLKAMGLRDETSLRDPRRSGSPGPA